MRDYPGMKIGLLIEQDIDSILQVTNANSKDKALVGLIGLFRCCLPGIEV
jgi:hypothetical protein